VEPTLGIHVVSKLAHRHGVDVELIRGVPGITARVTVPREHLEAVEKTQPKHQEGDQEREGEGPDPAEYHDAATREYILKRTTREPEPTSVASESPRVIDLTAEQAEDDLDPAPHPSGGLPIRNPGQSLADDDSTAATTGPGEGAIGIKSALAAFDAGRRAAEEKGESEDDDQ
jgi:hypothetical protein